MRVITEKVRKTNSLYPLWSNTMRCSAKQIKNKLFPNEQKF